MSRALLGWSAAFAFFSGGSVLMVATEASRDENIVPRDAASMSALDLEVIAGKIREGDLLAAASDLEGARRAWKDARGRGLGLAPVHEGLGDSHARIGEHALAAREYSVALRLNPEARVRTKCARSLRALARDDEALDLAQEDAASTAVVVEVLAARPDLAARVEKETATRPWLWWALHRMHEKAQRAPQSAVALARYVREAAPWDGALVRHAVEQARRSGLADEAVAVCGAYAKAVPQDDAVYDLLGQILEAAQRPHEALVAYTSAVDVRPLDAQAHLRLAEHLARLGRPDDARAEIAAAQKVSPDVNISLALAALLPCELRITMTWDSTADVDLYVTEPSGTRVFYSNVRGAGRYHVDDTNGYGPETYSLEKATGTYRVAARLHSGAAPTTVRLVVELKGVRTERTIALDRMSEERGFDITP